MRPEVLLGYDPAPGDPGRLIALSDALRQTIRGLVDARSALDALGRAGSVWDVPLGAPIATLLRAYAAQLSTLEESLVDCLQVVDGWRATTASHQAQVADVVSALADLAGEGATERRARLHAVADEIRTEHDRAAADLVRAFEELSSVADGYGDAEGDLAVELDRALSALAVAVEEWISAEAPELLRTALALGEVAGLTTVISELVGIAALGRSPGEADGVGAIIARSPGSHRLVRALRRQWLELAPEDLPAATFGLERATTLADAVAGRGARSAAPDADGGRP